MSDISELLANIHKLDSALVRLADRTLQAEYGLGMSQFKILWILKKHQGGVLQANIADWSNQTEAAVSRQIRLLKTAKLIEKRTDPKNRRNRLIVLSKSGNKFAEEAMERLKVEYRPLLAVLKPKDQQLFNQMCEKLFYSVSKTL